MLMKCAVIGVGKGLTLGSTRLVGREFPGHRKADRPGCIGEETLESARDTWILDATSTPAVILAAAQATGYRAERVLGATEAHCGPSQESDILSKAKGEEDFPDRP
jgi:hypothetical protein